MVKEEKVKQERGMNKMRENEALIRFVTVTR